MQQHVEACIAQERYGGGCGQQRTRKNPKAIKIRTVVIGHLRLDSPLAQKLPEPDPPLTVGIDGDYAHAQQGDNRKAGWLEVIFGKSMLDTGGNKRFTFVNQYDEKPERCLYEMLKRQGLALHQAQTRTPPLPG